MTHCNTLATALNSERFSHTSLADGTGVILDIEGEQVLTLNETSEFLVAALLVGVADPAELVSRLVAEFEVDPPPGRGRCRRLPGHAGSADHQPLIFSPVPENPHSSPAKKVVVRELSGMIRG